jgi:prepilin-type N-terminal cleavage/methylation domain-containing protein
VCTRDDVGAMKGFSLIELMLAMAITLSVAAASFAIFRRSERVFQDQYFLAEAQQTARAAASQIQDEIRIVGQGVPVYSATYDASPSEATVLILPGSDSTRLNIRAGISNVESNVVSPLPMNLTLGSVVTITVGSAAPFSDSVGANPTGRFVYVWGPAGDSNWAWVRAAINTINTSIGAMQITPSQAGDAGRLAGSDGKLNTADDVIRFTAAPAVSLEEAIALYFDNAGAIRRTTASNLTNLSGITWAPANELAINVTSLSFLYYDHSDNLILPSILANRAQVARVDARIVVQTADALSDCKRASVALPVRSLMRNAR